MGSCWMMSKKAPSLLTAKQLAGQCAGQVEAEAVHVHFLDPIAQAVHDELQHARMDHVQRVAASGKVHVVALVLRRQPVVGGVVDAAHRQRRPHVVALGGVVVNHVEDDFEAGGVQGADHHLELMHRLAGALTGDVAQVGGEKRQRVISPVVAQPLLDEVPFVHVMMDRHQLDGRDAEAGEVLDGGLGGDAGVGALELPRHTGHSLGEALDVQLVNERLVPGRARWSVVAPGEGGVHHGAERGEGGVVAVVGGQVVFGVAYLVAEERIVPAQVAADGLGVGVEEDFARVEAVAVGRVVRPVDAVAVELIGLHVRQVGVPDHVGVFCDGDAFGFLGGLHGIEETQLHFRRVLGKEGEVDARPVPRRPEGVRTARPYAHERSLSDEIRGRTDGGAAAAIGFPFSV